VPDSVVTNTSYVTPTGRVLRHEATIPAPVEAVWLALTTTEGLKSFMAPVISLDFRIGGRWEASYDPRAKLGDPENIINEVICYLPMEMLSIRILSAPSGFPGVEAAKQLWTVMQLRDLQEQGVRVSVSMLGWQEGADWDTVYALFTFGNEYTLGKLYQRFTEGPMQW
jgi:uncharacterized protein YndB with AHSA1/START domain